MSPVYPYYSTPQTPAGLTWHDTEACPKLNKITMLLVPVCDFHTHTCTYIYIYNMYIYIYIYIYFYLYLYIYTFTYL